MLGKDCEKGMFFKRWRKTTGTIGCQMAADSRGAMQRLEMIQKYHKLYRGGLKNIRTVHRQNTMSKDSIIQ